MNKSELIRLKNDYYYLLDHSNYNDSLELIGHWFNIVTLEQNNVFKNMAAERARDLVLQYTEKYSITIVDENQIVLIDTTSTSGENDTTIELKF